MLANRRRAAFESLADGEFGYFGHINPLPVKWTRIMDEAASSSRRVLRGILLRTQALRSP